MTNNDISNKIQSIVTLLIVIKNSIDTSPKYDIICSLGSCLSSIRLLVETLEKQQTEKEE